MAGLAVGSVRAQLESVLDAARAEATANVMLACEPFVIEFSFRGNRIVAEAGRDASKLVASMLEQEDIIVLEILGWRRLEDSDTFVRQWHSDTPSRDVADDALRALEHGYRRGETDDIELKVLLQPKVSVAAS